MRTHSRLSAGDLTRDVGETFMQTLRSPLRDELSAAAVTIYYVPLALALAVASHR